ncbi:MAG: CapA family protein [Lachnospiraceae bacterium]|nr:CapA family protein [Lachnospiraceae bacterium]
MKKRVYLRICLCLTVLLFTGCGVQNTVGEQVTGSSTETISESELPVEIQESKDTQAFLDTEVMTESTEILPKQESPTVTIVMVGDMLMHTAVNDSGKQEDGSYNYDHLFTNVQTKIQEADLALVNQEVIISGRDAGLKGYPRFNSAYELGDSLVKAGFDVVLHATNHAMDMGREGLLRCVSFWEETYPWMDVVGIYDDEASAGEICIREVEGIRIAILNYTYGTNGIALPKDMPYAVDLWDEDAIRADIALAREQADFIIVCPHWGTEYVFEETKKQKKWAQFLADEGVDLCIGTHPHVIEPVKWVTGKDGNEMLVYYSIGNFINATSGTASGVSSRMLGAMAQVTITMEENQCEIKEYDALPLVAHVEKKGPISTYFLQDYTEELAQKHYMTKADPDNFSLTYLWELYDRVIGDLHP